jgi:hypothetical protein
MGDRGVTPNQAAKQDAALNEYVQARGNLPDHLSSGGFRAGKRRELFDFIDETQRQIMEEVKIKPEGGGDGQGGKQEKQKSAKLKIPKGPEVRTDVPVYTTEEVINGRVYKRRHSPQTVDGHKVRSARSDT